jgi:hypothetical protein
MAGIAVVDIFSYNTTQLYNFELYIKNSDWASQEHAGLSACGSRPLITFLSPASFP